MILKEEEDSVVDYHSLSDEPKPLNCKQVNNLCEECFDSKFHSWDFKENYTYITYLRNYRFIFDSAYARKRIKVFSHISKLLKTRNPLQIKSHHQKVMMRHTNVDRIIEYLKLKKLKFLRASPNSMEDIERINRQCEAFFIEQAPFVNEQDIRRCQEQAIQNREIVKSYKRNRKVKDQEEKSKREGKKQIGNEEEMEIQSGYWQAGADRNKRKM